MTLRTFMHPRNIYKKVPNFKQLAILYPEFREKAITELSGKVRIDFKNEDSLRVLARTLLKHDFGLEVEIPPKKLVPTVPLRINYILWIEDLMRLAKYTDMTTVRGIDIGTGAVCIYPLLFAKMYGCKMIGTEIESSSIQSAISNVERNNLQRLIQVISVNKQTILEGVVSMDETYSFTMCNPPFFESDEGAKYKSALSASRLPPRNALTGNEGELMVRGGERTFVSRMIDESMKIGNRVKVYTTMLGRKSSLNFLLLKLKRSNIENMTWTEFCQGRTKRWGLAWTFLPKDIINLTTAFVIRTKRDNVRLNRQKAQPPVEIVLPPRDTLSCTDDVAIVVKQWISEELHIESEELELNDEEEDVCYWACRFTAYEDSWSHARRKRRAAKHLQNSLAKRAHSELTQPIDESASQLKVNSFADIDNNSNDINENTESNYLSGLDKASSTQQDPSASSDIKIDTESRSGKERATKDSVTRTTFQEPFLVCTLLIVEAEETEDEDEESKPKVRIRIIFENGRGGKSALETFRQCLINKLNVREYFQKHSTHRTKKRRK